MAGPRGIDGVPADVGAAVEIGDAAEIEEVGGAFESEVAPELHAVRDRMTTTPSPAHERPLGTSRVRDK